MTGQSTDAAVAFVPRSAPSAAASEACGARAGAGFSSASVALLDRLESSLKASQSAVLARDVAGLERHTAEQIRLRRGLETLGSLDIPGSEDGPLEEGDSVQANDARRCGRAGAAERRAAQMRVLHHGRVLAALLERAQRSLRVLAHLLAGPGAGYAAGAGIRFPELPGKAAEVRRDAGQGRNVGGQTMPGREKPGRPGETLSQKNAEVGDPCRA